MSTNTEQTAAGSTTGAPGGRRSPVILIVILLGLLLVMGLGTALMLSSQSSRLATAQQEHDQALGELDQREEVVEVAHDEQIREAIGADPQRLADDAAVIDRLAGQITTWDSGQSYAQARADLIEQLGLSEDDAFVTDFMPEAASNVDGNGERTYYLDVMGIDSSLSFTQIGLDAVVADEYRYTVVLETTISSEAVESSSSPGGADSSSGRMLLQLSVNSEGEISDLSGSAAGAETRGS